MASFVSTNFKFRSQLLLFPVEARLQCKLYVTQLLLALTCASDGAVDALRSTDRLTETLLRCSSYARKERTRRWLRYPGEMARSAWFKLKGSSSRFRRRRRPFIEAVKPSNDFNGRVQGTANQVLAAIGYNEWVPKIPGQRGLRILCLDGGGRGRSLIVVGGFGDDDHCLLWLQLA